MARSANIVRIFLVVALFGAPVCGLSAKPKSSLSDSEIEVAEAKLTLEQLLEENAKLREKAAITQAEAAKMAESLIVAQSESEVFRRQTAELKLRIEALGLDSADGSSAKLQERLLQIASNYRLSEEERKKLSTAMSGMLDAIGRYLKASQSKDAEARLALETQIRSASESLGQSRPGVVEAAPVAATLTDGMIISIKDELSLVVTNIGSKQGVKVGMPFQVLRGDQLIGTVRVIDAREKIAGAVIQNLISERNTIKVGDRVKIASAQ